MHALRRRPEMRRAWTILGAWTALGLFFLGQAYVCFAALEQEISWSQIFGFTMADVYLLAVLTPPVLWFARRVPITQQRSAGRILAHVAAALLFSGLHILLHVTTVEVFGWNADTGQPLGAVLGEVLLSRTPLNLFIYAGLVGGYYTFDYYRKYQERELHASQLEAQLAQAQLQALKMQLHPHFLHNTLHAISTLVHQDADAADEMIARLSDLLRSTLDSDNTQFVSLKDELDVLDTYLDIEQMRFQHRLEIEREIDAAALDVAVPTLILQPLVENAIRHGIAQRAAARCITIRATRHQNRLRIQIQDDGPGLARPATAANGQGVGLANTKARLEQHYGCAYELTLRNRDTGGAEVILELPAQHPEPSAQPATVSA